MRGRAWAQAGLMLAAAWFVFSPAFHGNWLWDDVSEIPNNANLRTPAGLARIWTHPAGPDYFPLKASLQWAQWQLWGDARLGYHLTNAALHLLGALLLWRLLRTLGLPQAWLAAFLFLVHPLMVESVAWISELKNVLSLPLLLLSFSAFIDFDAEWAETKRLRVPLPESRPSVPSASSPEIAPSASSLETAPSSVAERASVSSGARRSYVLALLLFLAALLCKTSVVVLPLLFLLHAWWRRGRIAASDWRAAAPFFGLAGVLGLITLWFQLHRAIVGWHLYQGGLGSRLAGAGVAISFYFHKFFWPWELLPIYPRWRLNPATAGQFLPWLALAAGAAWLWAARDRLRPVLFGLGWFLASLLPVLGFVPMSFLHIAPVADHLAYLPAAGLAIAATAAFDIAMRWASTSGRRQATSPAELPSPVKGGLLPLIAAAAVAIGLLAWKSHAYAGKFVNQETLWGYTLARNPSSPAVHGNLAFILGHDKRMPESIAHYQEALRLAPDDAYLECELAEAYVANGQSAEGIRHFERAVQIDPMVLEAQQRLGDLLAKAGRPDEAAAHYRKALQLQPEWPDVENSLGVILAGQGRIDEAIVHYKTALHYLPDFPQAENNLGLALAKEALWNEAMDHFRKAIQLDPKMAKAHDNLGYALGATARPAEALREFEQAARLGPNVVEFQNNLGFALARAGQPAQAIGSFRSALRLNPTDATAHFNLGVVLQAAGRPAEARLHFAEALKLRPNFAQARRRLEDLDNSR